MCASVSYWKLLGVEGFFITSNSIFTPLCSFYSANLYIRTPIVPLLNIINSGLI